jgi:Tol biopolymer transport system component
MPDVREVYEMITKQKTSEPGALERQQKRQVRAARNRKFGAFAVAAAIGVAAVALILATSGGPNTTTPANQPSTVAPGTASLPFFLDARTGKRTPLAKNLAGGVSYVASPDGTRLVYNTCRGQECSDGADVMTVANIDGTDARTLESPDGLNYYGARWSPDGTKLVYQGRNVAVPDSVGNLFVQDLSTGRRTQLTHLKLPVPAVLTDLPSRGVWWFLSPSFSPDGRNVIFQMPRSSPETTKWDVWSVPVTGGEPTLLLRNASFPMLNPSGGPEGVAIAFVSPMPNDFQGRSIMTGRPIPESDIRRTLVEANISIWWPTFSPDGRRIAYQDGGSIYVVNVAPWGLSSKVAEGSTAEWLDNDTLIVAP